MNNKLQTVEVKEMPVWIKHFMVHVVKRCAKILIDWIEQVQETGKTIDQGEKAGYNSRNGN